MSSSRRWSGLFARSSALLAVIFVLVCGEQSGLAQCPPGWLSNQIGTPGIEGDATALAVLPDGDVIAGGHFSRAGGVYGVGGVPANNIARYHPGTNTWAALGTGVTRESDDDFYEPWVQTVLVLPSGDLIVGGHFDTAGGIPARSIARYHSTTGEWSAIGPIEHAFDGVSYDGSVYSLALLPNGEVLVGGSFNNAGGVAASSIARYSPATGAWSAIGAGLTITYEGEPTPSPGNVAAIAVTPSGYAIVGGWFDTAGGVAATNVARLGLVTGEWSSLAGQAGMFEQVSAIVTLPNGDVVVAGGTATPTDLLPSLWRLGPATGVWSQLGTGAGVFSGTGINALSVTPNGDVIAAGPFALYMPPSPPLDPSIYHIGRCNPMTNTWIAMGSGFHYFGFGDGQAECLALLPGGDVLAGGAFNLAGTVQSQNIARYTFGMPAPSIAAPLQGVGACSGGPAALSISATGSGTLGYRWRKGGVPIDIAANPSAATASLSFSSVSVGDMGSYDCIVSNAGGCGSVTSNSALLTVSTCCPADIGAQGGVVGSDGTLDNNDFVVFIDYFFNRNPFADKGMQGGVPGSDGAYDNNDFVVFIDQFFAGC